MGAARLSVAGGELRRIVVVTGSRAEYGLLKPVMEEIRKSFMELRLVVAGMHLQSEFGQTIEEIVSDGFDVEAPNADHPGEIIEYQPLYRSRTGVGCAMGFVYWDLQ